MRFKVHGPWITMRVVWQSENKGTKGKVKLLFPSYSKPKNTGPGQVDMVCIDVNIKTGHRIGFVMFWYSIFFIMQKSMYKHFFFSDFQPISPEQHAAQQRHQQQLAAQARLQQQQQVRG